MMNSAIYLSIRWENGSDLIIFVRSVCDARSLALKKKGIFTNLQPGVRQELAHRTDRSDRH